MASIPIYVVAGRALIYDIEDLKRLREEYHISGTLIGILPQIPQQNVFMGLPLELMLEDVHYLVKELKVAHLVHDKYAHELAVNSMRKSDVEQIEKTRQENQAKQIEQYKETTWERRQAALEKKAKKKGEEFVPEDDEKKRQVFDSMSNSIDSGVSISIPTVTDVPGYNLFNRPTTTNETQRIKYPQLGPYNMFKYLHERGYYLSPGIRFGGQFLAYPGDPLRFHSHHTAIGFENHEKFGIIDIVGGGRLGTAVKKCWVVGAEDDNGEYRSYSVEWAGFG